MKKFPGFTLIELLVVVVVVGVGFALAVPSFQGMVARNRLATNSNELMLAINLARSEASKRAGQIVSLQALNAVNGNEFGGGYCVVLGDPGNCNNPVIRTFSALSGDTSLAGVDDAANGGIAFVPPLELNLPVLAPSTIAPAKAAEPPAA